MPLLPSPRLETKLRYRPAERHFSKPGLVSQRQVKCGLGANNNIAAACLVQITDQFSRKKSGIGQQSNPRARHLRGNLLQTSRHQNTGAGIGSGISGTQRSVPKLLAVSFETEDRVTGAPAQLLWVVTHARPLLFR